MSCFVAATFIQHGLLYRSVSVTISHNIASVTLCFFFFSTTLPPSWTNVFLYTDTSSRWSVVLYNFLYLFARHSGSPACSDKCMCVRVCVSVRARVSVSEFCSCPFWPYINWNERIHQRAKHLSGHQNTFWIRLFQFSLSITSVLLFISLCQTAFHLWVCACAWMLLLFIYFLLNVLWKFCAENQFKILINDLLIYTIIYLAMKSQRIREKKQITNFW